MLRQSGLARSAPLGRSDASHPALARHGGLFASTGTPRNGCGRSSREDGSRPAARAYGRLPRHADRTPRRSGSRRRAPGRSRPEIRSAGPGPRRAARTSLALGPRRGERPRHHGVQAPRSAACVVRSGRRRSLPRCRDARSAAVPSRLPGDALLPPVSSCSN